MYFYALNHKLAMKRFLITALIVIGLSAFCQGQEHRRYALIWNDEFNSETLDNTVWSKIWRHSADWAIHMSSHDSLYAFENGDLVLYGLYNDFLPEDTAAFLTGGVWSKDRKAFGFGRIEIRAKFDVAQGFWPAIWMLPQAPQSLQWPYGGEIDIMEHFRSNPTVNQTVHSNYTFYLRKLYNPSQVAFPKYNEGEYNTYGMERFQDSLVFFVNGKRTFCYPRFRDGVDGQFPFSNHDFYLILDAQLGRDRSPYIDTAKLPVALRVDYVRYYELDTKTDIIPEPKDFQQFSKRKYKLRKIKTDSKTVYDNPDEYHLIVRKGKAVVSGNVNWAKSTLAQLTDENGKVPEVEIHDWATCPYRGIALDAKNPLPSPDSLMALLDLMAFYKLNCLFWDNTIFSKEDAERVREYACKLNIEMLSDTIPNLKSIKMEHQVEFPASNRIFLQKAEAKGAFLLWEKADEASLDAMMAFSERFWRGGDAGTMENEIPNALTTAGSRLTNFKEKMAVHASRYHKKL